MSQLLSRWCPWPAATLFLCFSPTSFKLLNSTPMQKILLEGRLLDMGGWQRWDLRLTCPPLWPGKSEVLRNRRAGGQREQGTGPGPAVPRGDGFLSELFALFYYFVENGWFFRFDMIYLRPLKLETPFSPLKWPDFLNKHITHFGLHPIHCIHCMHW